MANVPGSPNDDTLYGTADADTITGLGGNDTLVGFGGADHIDGGNGTDTAFYFDSSAGVGVNLTTGDGFGGSAQGDELVAVENLQGSNFNDTFTGTSGVNELFGLNGNDILKGGGGADGLDGGSGNDIMKGGGGADHFIGGSGSDTLDYSQSTGPININLTTGNAEFGEAAGDTFLEMENVTGTNNGDGSQDSLIGDANNNTLRGIGGPDQLTGKGGSDRLEGGDGNDSLFPSEVGITDPDDGVADVMLGGRGDDQYTVRGAGDAIIELANEGYDKVGVAIANYTLPDNVEEASMGFTATNGVLRGNAQANLLQGNSDPNTIDGRAGADTMHGNGGSDLLFVDNFNDIVIETMGAGNAPGDRVLTSVSYLLTAGAGIELFTTIDSSLTTAINLIGNEAAQTIIGNSGDNGLTGAGGNDSLNGGLGNDTYYLAADNDAVIDSGGFDTISSTVSRSLLDHTAIERLVLDGAGDINGIGNALANQLFGSTGKNTLQGGLGADILIGRLGRDVLTGGADNDVFDFNAANETGNDANTRDAITDFTQGQDRIDLATIDADGVLSGDAFAFIGAAAFTGVAGQLRFTQIDDANDTLDQTIVEADMDGNATSDFQIKLTGLITLTAGDFSL